MKEYGCCPKFKRGDNSTYTFTKRGGMYLVSGDNSTCGLFKKKWLQHVKKMSKLNSLLKTFC
jgi:hypothetical protein